MRTLVPLCGDPAGWHVPAGPDTAVTAVLDLPPGGAGSGRAGDVGAVGAAVERLAGAGVALLGRVDLHRGARPLAEVLADVRTWSAYPVNGVFLDRTPGDPAGAGPVALALRVARRTRLTAAVLNPGRHADPLYRRLDARLCVFDDDWDAYLRWDAADARPGDGHLVCGVPEPDLPAAHRLAAARGAGLALITSRDTMWP